MPLPQPHGVDPHGRRPPGRVVTQGALLVLVVLLLAPGSGSGHVVPAGPGGASPRTTSGPAGPFSWNAFGAYDSPSPRAYAGAASFAAYGYGLAAVVGGSGACGRFCNDTWLLNFDDPQGPTWFQGGEAGAQGRLAPSVAYDAASGQVVAFGGLNGTVGPLNSTWVEVPYVSGWAPILAGPAPAPRWSASVAYDPALGGVVLFGGVGVGGKLLSDTWVFRGNLWQALPSPVSPPGRSGAMLLWQSREQRLVLFGGNGSAGPLSDTWAFSGGTWYPLHPGTSPPARSNASAWSDGAGDPVLFAGEGADGPLNDTWTFYDDNWSAPSPLEPGQESPAPIEGAIAIEDLTSIPNDFVFDLGRTASGFSELPWEMYLSNGGSPSPPPPLQLTAQALPTNGEAPLTVGFQAFGAEGTPPYSYRWDFGDGTGSTLELPSHTYAAPGAYQATVVVEDAAFPPDTLEQQLTVTVAAPPAAFSVTFAPTPTSGVEPLTVSFTPTPQGGTGPFTSRWTFGDGSAPSTLATPTHTYAKAGSFLVNLTLNDSLGQSARWSATVVVEGLGLHLGLEASPTEGAFPLPVQFHTVVGGGTPNASYEYLWNFGDGNVTSGPVGNLTHWYNGSGNFTVDVTAVDALGANASASLVISVVAPTPPPPPPTTWYGPLVRALGAALDVLLQPEVLGGILLALVLVVAVRFGVPELQVRRALRRGAGSPRLGDQWGLSEVGLVVGALRERHDLPSIWHELRPLLRRDARALAERLRWRPGPTAVWTLRRAILLPPQLLIAATVLFVGLDLVPTYLSTGSTSAIASTPGAFVGAWWGYISGLVVGGFSDPYLQAYLPYTLQLMAVVVGLSVALSYPLGLWSGWYRGRAVDQATRGASVFAFSIPIVVVALVVLGAAWLWYYNLTGGDSLVGSLPAIYWDGMNYGGVPSWIGVFQNSAPTGFVLVDAPLHGAWLFEEVVLLKMLLQGFPIAAVYSAIFLRYARLATEEASNELSLVGGRARGLGDGALLWKHTSRRVAPIYVAIFGTTFPTLLFVQIVAEWFYNDLGIGQLFILALANVVVEIGSTQVLGWVAFVLLLLIFSVNAVTDVLSRALDPSGRGRGA